MVKKQFLILYFLFLYSNDVQASAWLLKKGSASLFIEGSSSDELSIKKLQVLRERYQYYNQKITNLDEQYRQHLTATATKNSDKLSHLDILDPVYLHKKLEIDSQALDRDAVKFARKKESLRAKRNRNDSFLIDNSFNIDLEYGFSDYVNAGIGFRRKLYNSSRKQYSYYLNSHALSYKVMIYDSQSATWSMQQKFVVEQDLHRCNYLLEQSISRGTSKYFGKIKTFNDYRLGLGRIIDYANYITLEVNEGCHLNENMMILGQASMFVTLNKLEERLSISRYQLSLVYKLPDPDHQLFSSASYSLQLGLSQEGISYSNQRPVFSRGFIYSIWINMS